ncbi:MAG: putative peptidoglycan-binding protein [Oscillospiraceae bacterium]|jgi:hypothetical protein|nr:putative peptidoglycan-binding protein [Oscillospiraceae bacterium]
MQKSRYVQIPDVIAVHLGGKDADAPNITISFVEYIKGCASCLICPTWPESAQRANIYAITTFALYRFCNRWYRARGYNFDITSSEEDDLPFDAKKCLFFNTSYLVWDMFDHYLTRQGYGDPIPTRICRNGQAAGSGVLCQLGAVAMAKEGSTVYDILKKYYGEDIAMVHNAPQEGGYERFLGTPLMPGASGDDICTIKRQLNRIGRNYPVIMPLAEDCPNFDAPCERAVRTFQYIFDLPVTGVLDKATWYKIKQTWANIVHHDTDLFEQEAVAVQKPVLGAKTGNPAQNSATFGSDVREAAPQERVVPRSGMLDIVVPGRLIPGVTLPNVIIPGDTVVDPVISDRGVAEKATWARRSPGNTALGNLSEWNTIRENSTQGETPPGSIISDQGVAAREKTESALPGEIIARDMVQDTIPEGTVPSNIPPGSVAPGSIISDRGIAARAETEGAIPGITQESFERSKTVQGEVVQQSALRQGLPPESNVPESPIKSPGSVTDHLVKIGPSVSTALPDEGGVESGHAVEWLRKFYGL